MIYDEVYVFVRNYAYDKIIISAGVTGAIIGGIQCTLNMMNSKVVPLQT